MENHPKASIESYWKQPESDNNVIYLFTRHISLKQFQLLLHRVKIFSRVPNSNPTGRPGVPETYQYLDEWSDLQQQALADMYIPGTHVAVDECVVGFTGQSKLKTTIPNKPTPTGFKVWVVAERGLFLYWIWHIPGKGPVGILRKPESAKINLNPTQKVVTHLLGLLPKAAYYVFLNNLFSSPKLFIILRESGIGASGIARINSGIFKELIEEKNYLDHKPWG